MSPRRPLPALDAALRLAWRGARPLLLLAAFATAVRAQLPAATIAPAQVPAAGRHTARVTVPAFGRYSVAVTSEQGVALELVDRAAGALGTAGRAGRADGRLDVFLERGEVLAVLTGDAKAKGAATLRVEPSVEVEPPPGPRLVEGKPVGGVLDDHRQRSWWLRLPERRRVWIEAAGRTLQDLRLWRDGAWLDPVAARCVTRQPMTGRPLRVCMLSGVVEPGLYRLSAYGGAALPWADEPAGGQAGEAHPFHLRWGVPRLPEAGRRRLVVSPFGVDRYLAPAATNFVRLELTASGAAALRAGNVLPRDPFFQHARAEGAIDKTTRPWAVERSIPAVSGADWDNDWLAPDAGDDVDDVAAAADEGAEEVAAEGDEGDEGDEEMAEDAPTDDESTADGADDASAADEEPADALAARNADRWIEVRGTPGQAYVLEQFALQTTYTYARPGQYWVSSVQAGAAGDDADASGVLVAHRLVNGRGRDELAAAAALALDAEHPLVRRFNALGDLTLFVHVQADGIYRLAARGVAARFRFQPFHTTPPREAKVPPLRGAGEAWTLSAGIYVLEVHPEAAGILELAVGGPGDPQALLDAARGAQGVPRGEARFGVVSLGAGESFTAYLGRRPDLATGIVLRAWPLDLAQALPLTVRPDDRITLEGAVAEPGTLRLVAEDGEPLALAVDDGTPGDGAEVAAGTHRVTIAGAGPRARSASLVFTPSAVGAEVPLAPLPQAELDALPAFPELVPGREVHLDLARGETATFRLRTDAAGPYEIASSGLLSTQGTLRTRTVLELERGDANGVGANFELRPYLGPGDYQVSVRTRGASAGHLGLAVRPTPLRDGGAVRPGVAGRATLAGGEGIAFRLHVPTAGKYRVLGAGDGFRYAGRLEDADGWPIVPPRGVADWRLELQPGDYRLVLLPRALPAKVVASLDEVETSATRSGHGPFPLTLGVEEVHVWEEPEEGREREQDRFTFHLAAPAHVAVAIDGEMQGTLARAGSGDEPILVPPGRGWKGELAAGDYTLAVECSRRNNYVGYLVSVRTAELVAGTRQSVDAPGDVAVAVGEGGLTEIASQARSGVRGVLLDAGGRAVLHAPARPDDWNFLLSARLAPGRYTLHVEPVSAVTGRVVETILTMRTPVEVEEAAAKLPLDRSFVPGPAVHLVPLPAPRGAELAVATAASLENVGCALEARTGTAWRTLASATGRAPRVAAALDPERPLPLRLRVWSVDGRGETLRLRAAVAAPRYLREADLRKGVALPAMPGLAGVGAAVVELGRAGVLRPAAAAAALGQSGARGGGLGVADDARWVALGRKLTLVGDGGARAQAERVAATPAAPFTVRLAGREPVVIDVAAANGPLLARARSLALVPGVRAGGAALDARSAATYSVAEAARPDDAGGAAVDVALRPAVSAVTLWDAAGDTPGDTELTIFRPAPQPARAVAMGVVEGVLDRPGAWPLDLPAGGKRVTLALGADTVAAFADGDRVESVHWAGGAAFSETVGTSAPRLVLLHEGDAPAPYRLEIEGAAVPPALRAGAPFEGLFDRAGSAAVRVDAPAGGRLHVRGAAQAATFVGDDGAAIRGEDLALRGGGALRIRHGVGAVVAWLDGGAAGGPWPAVATPAVAQAAGSVPLAGAAVRLRVAIDDGRALQLRTAVPVVAVVERAGGAEVTLYPAGARLHALGEQGFVDVTLHALGGGTLVGTAELATTPVTELREGLGAPVLLAGGDRRFFAFEVPATPATRRVGVGVRSDASGLECELLSAGGRALGRGVLQLVDLAPGRYLVALALPPDAAPANARPVVVGLVVPTGPPPDWQGPGERSQEPAAQDGGEP